MGRNDRPLFHKFSCFEYIYTYTLQYHLLSLASMQANISNSRLDPVLINSWRYQHLNMSNNLTLLAVYFHIIIRDRCPCHVLCGDFDKYEVWSMSKWYYWCIAVYFHIIIRDRRPCHVLACTHTHCVEGSSSNNWKQKCTCFMVWWCDPLHGNSVFANLSCLERTLDK